ncbi:2',5'-phosphodiesterase 12 [Coccinella septempunctata]|uniref:2',5'-phosphodiesterase 12 n=1 Tax=Coccinella septempunctata TaxID=41139 RepID=UPI001D07EC0A|nr:2',5'-phosphodiesterase 12 [Coccinella septempunctata]
MLFKNILLFIPKRFVHKYLLKMDKAYFRKLEDLQQFSFTFQYENAELKVNRQFNFVRQISEPLSAFLTRLETNVDKVIKKKNKKKDPTTIPSNLNIGFTVNGMNVQNGTCEEIFTLTNAVQLRILDKVFDVIINSPWIDSLGIPSSILAGFPTYPNKFEAYNTDSKESDFIWYTSKDGKTWSEQAKGFMFTPGNDLIDCYLKLSCTPRHKSLEGPTVEVECNAKIQAGPGNCPFETRHQFTKNKTPGNGIRVVTYNILADLYCDSDYTRDVLHPYCPAYALQLDYRKQLILKELLGYNADIICLQEVDRKVYNHDLTPFFSRLGFEGDYAIKGGEVAEGVACFFSLEKFVKLESSRVVFSEHLDKDPIYSQIWEKISANEPLVTRIMDLKSTLQTVLLQSKVMENELVLLANTHLYFHPDADHIRLIQGGLAITYIQSCLDNFKSKYPDRRISVIFCGDFNSVPECGIFKLYTTGFVPDDFIDFSSNKDEEVKNLELRQNIPLDSACGTPQYTNFTSGFADCLDYIFYQKTNLKVTQVVPLPSNEELTQHTALPSIVAPSDHVALISDLEWI